MANEQTTRGRAADRKLVAGQQRHEVAYETKKTGATKEAVTAAVGKVGNSRSKVEQELARKPVKRAR